MSDALQLPTFRLDGKRAVVTGAGRGIGAASAIALANAGAAVTLVSRTRAELDAVAETIRAAGGEASVQPLDVTDTAAVNAWSESQPAFDILVNNAGMNRPKHFHQVTEDDYDAIMGLNVRAAFFFSQAISRKMVADKTAGSIIHMSSQMGHVGGATRTVYCASKWALEGFTKAMSIDLAPNGIRVNTICPTFVETPMTKGFLADETFRTNVLAKIKLGRLAKVDDIIGAVVYLAGDASAMTTGTSLVIDGGWTAD